MERWTSGDTASLSPLQRWHWCLSWYFFFIFFYLGGGEVTIQRRPWRQSICQCPTLFRSDSKSWWYINRRKKREEKEKEKENICTQETKEPRIQVRTVVARSLLFEWTANWCGTPSKPLAAILYRTSYTPAAARLASTDWISIIYLYKSRQEVFFRKG